MNRRDFFGVAALVGTGMGMTTSGVAGEANGGSVFHDLEIVTVCSADKDFPRHSEASIIELNDSTLLIAWQRFEASRHGSGDNAPATISLMNSSNGGRSWDNFRIAAERDENSINVYSPNFLRLKNGEILLLYMEYNQLETGKPQLATAYSIRSQNEGGTFGPPVPIWQREQLGFSNSCLMRLSSGRVILPAMVFPAEVWTPNDQQRRVSVCYSDDDCKTWVFGQKNISLPMRGAMEPFVAELKDGRLIMVMRNQLGSVFKSYSADQGENWSLPQTTHLSAPESCPYVTSIPGSDKIMVVWNNTEYNPQWRSHYGKRTPLTAAISADGGVTFTNFWDIETDPNVAFSNPGITWTKDGVCLLTYWACPYTKDWVFSGLIDLKLARFRVRM